MFSAGIWYQFPVVLAIHERSVGYHCSEQIVGFVKKCMSVVAREINFFWRVVRIPAEFVNIWQEAEILDAKSWLLFLVFGILLYFIIFIILPLRLALALGKPCEFAIWIGFHFFLNGLGSPEHRLCWNLCRTNTWLAQVLRILQICRCCKCASNPLL